MCVCVCVWGGWLCPLSTDSSFLFTENIQFSYVSLHCTSSRQQIRNRHGRKAGEEDGSSITADFELDVNLEEVTGWSSCPSTLPLVLHLFFSLLLLVKVSPVLTLLWWWAPGGLRINLFCLISLSSLWDVASSDKMVLSIVSSMWASRHECEFSGEILLW